MTTTFGANKAIHKAIKAFIQTTRLSDRAIAAALDVEQDLVKTIRQELKAEALATKETKFKTVRKGKSDGA